MDERKRIRIIKPPKSAAPEWIQEACVGLEFYVTEYNPSEQRLKRVDIFGGDELEHEGGYYVEIVEFLNGLKQVNPEAEKWCRENIPYAIPGQTQIPLGKMLTGRVRAITFGEEYCEVINE